VLAVPWLLLFNQLRVEWSVNAQYNYGWGVPFLAAYLFWRRWENRPEPAPHSALGTYALALGAAALLLLLPVRLVQESNPDWRLIAWVFALLNTALCLAALWFAGGRPWVRHFAISVAFLLLAVPWPSGFEDWLVQNLMRAVAAFTVEILNLLGVIARQRGNLIELTSGVVGINEACSGVRSFQSTLMISIFLGELHRFSAARRGLLLGGGVLLAFALNVVRSFFLTWICVRNGPAAIDSWHDPAGLAVFGLSFLGLLGFALWLRHRKPAEAPPPPEHARAPRPLPLRFSVACGVWIAGVLLASDLWYRSHERDTRPAPGWTVAWPMQAPQYKDQEISERIRRTLGFNTGSSASWFGADGTQWLGYYFRWEPGRASAQRARSHTPEVCLPAAGFQLTTEHELQAVPVQQLTIPFRAYTFSTRNQPLYVFFCVWEDRVSEAGSDSGARTITPGSRLRAVAEGRRHLGQQVLQVVVAGPPDIGTARARLSAELERLIRPVRRS